MKRSISMRSACILGAVIVALLVRVIAANSRARLTLDHSDDVAATPIGIATYVRGRGPSSASTPLPIVAGATRQYYFPADTTPNPDVTEAERVAHLRHVRPYVVCSEDEAVAFVMEKTHTSNWKQFIAKRTSLIQLETWQAGLDPIDPAMENSPLVWIVGFEAEANLTMANIYGRPGEPSEVSTSPYMRMVFSEDKRVISSGGDEPIYAREGNEPIFRYSGFRAFPDLPSQIETQEPYFRGLCALPLN